MKALSRLSVLAFAFVVLSGCYMPVWFDAEIELDRYGYYDMKFSGYMTQVELYKDIMGGKVQRGSAEELERVKRIETDFRRDSSTKAFKYMKEGVFQVQWEKQGDILRSKTATFFRRNENFLSITFLEPQGAILVRGAPISKTNADRLAKIGLGMEGQLRIRTNAPIRGHNAHKELKGDKPRWKVLVWNIADLYAKTPSLTVSMR